MSGPTQTKESTLHITDLVDELLIKIICCLCTPEAQKDVLHLGLTCKRFQNLVNDRAVWFNIFAAHFDVHPYHLKNPNIQTLCKTRLEMRTKIDVGILARVALENKEKNIRWLTEGSKVLAFYDVLYDFFTGYGVSSEERVDPVRHLQWPALLGLACALNADSTNFTSPIPEILNEEIYMCTMYGIFPYPFRDKNDCIVAAIECQLSTLYMLTGTELHDENVPPPIFRETYHLYSQSLMDPECIPEYNEHIANMLGSLNGRWVGYYTYGTPDEMDISRLDAPMEITLTTRDEDEPGLVVLDGRGRDSVEQFTIEGMMEKKYGQFKLNKRYPALGPLWEYRGCLTPWGFAGVWGDPTDPEQTIGGTFWIWKA